MLILITALALVLAVLCLGLFMNMNRLRHQRNSTRRQLIDEHNAVGYSEYQLGEANDEIIHLRDHLTSCESDNRILMEDLRNARESINILIKDAERTAMLQKYQGYKRAFEHLAVPVPAEDYVPAAAFGPGPWV